MKTTRYFDEQVLRKRPYLSLDMCLTVLQSPLNKVVQPEGRGAGKVKLHYYPETDSLYIELMSKPGVETREIVAGLVADFDAEGAVVGFDIDGASRKLDLATLETVALPLMAMKVA